MVHAASSHAVAAGPKARRVAITAAGTMAAQDHATGTRRPTATATPPVSTTRSTPARFGSDTAPTSSSSGTPARMASAGSTERCLLEVMAR